MLTSVTLGALCSAPLGDGIRRSAKAKGLFGRDGYGRVYGQRRGAARTIRLVTKKSRLVIRF